MVCKTCLRKTMAGPTRGKKIFHQTTYEPFFSTSVGSYGNATPAAGTVRTMSTGGLYRCEWSPCIQSCLATWWIAVASSLKCAELILLSGLAGVGLFGLCCCRQPDLDAVANASQSSPGRSWSGCYSTLSTEWGCRSVARFCRASLQLHFSSPAL